MTDRSKPPFPHPDHPLDRLVRAVIEHQAGEVRVDDLLMRGLGHRQQRRSWLVGLPAVIAACLVLALFAVQPGHQARASPAQILVRAQSVHAAGDRCYRLSTQVREELRQRFPFLKSREEGLLWTRGDRFRVEPGVNGKGSWGRDERGRVWLAPSSTEGASFEAEEIPRALQELLTVRSVEVTDLLRTVLYNCDLNYLPEFRPGQMRIQATARPGTVSTLVGAVLDIDSRHVVQHLTLHRKFLGKEQVVVRLQFQEMRSQPDLFYRLDGQLAPKAVILDRSRPLLRLRFMLKNHLGGES